MFATCTHTNRNESLFTMVPRINGCRRATAIIVAGCILGITAAEAVAQPTISEDGWTLTNTWTVPSAGPVAYNPDDGLVYAGVRQYVHSGGAIKRLLANGDSESLFTVDRPSGLEFDESGNMFCSVNEFTYDYISKTTFDPLAAEPWVDYADPAPGNSDYPTGIAIVPSSYTGGVVPPGAALSGDRGISGDKNPEVWQWSTTTAGSPVELINGWTDGSDVLAGVSDIAANDTQIMVLDSSGQIWELVKDGANYELTKLNLAVGVGNIGLVFDPWNGDLLALGYGVGGDLKRVDLDTLEISTVLDSVNAGNLSFDSLAFSSDGRHLYVSSYGNSAVYEYTRVPDVLLPGDANDDGRVDDADATLLASNWQTLTGATWAMGDFNEDKAVNDIDATMLAANWQNGVSDAVPEPGALTLLTIGGLTLLGLGARRRKRYSRRRIQTTANNSSCD